MLVNYLHLHPTTAYIACMVKGRRAGELLSNSLDTEIQQYRDIVRYDVQQLTAACDVTWKQQTILAPPSFLSATKSFRNAISPVIADKEHSMLPTQT